MPPDPVSPRVVLGVDPGTRVTGWGVVAREGRALVARGHGVVRADPRAPLAARLATIAQGLRAVLAEHAPDAAAVEEAFHGRDARAALHLGQGRGAALLVLAEAGLPVTGYANNVVKQAVVGAGRATKEQVRAMVVRLLGLDAPPERLDASDALAVAVCHLQRGPAARGRAAAGGPSARFLGAVEAARRRDRAAARPGRG